MTAIEAVGPVSPQPGGGKGPNPRPTAADLPVEPGAGIPSALELLLSKGRVRASLAMLGPAFVASIAYVDPGNFATNFAGRRAVRLPAAVGRAGREHHRDADPVPLGQAGHRDRR